MMQYIIFLTMCYSAFALSMYPARMPYDYNPGPPLFQSNIQCPNVNCTKEPSKLQPCKSDDECLQKEACCNFPCQEGENFCMKGNMNYYETHVLECLVIKNCKKWKEENKELPECEDNGDCGRTEKCCFIPCYGKRMCQKPVEVILNSGSPIYKPIPIPPPRAIP